MSPIKKIILKTQVNKEGYCIIYFEISKTIDSKRKRKRLNSGIKVLPKYWLDKSEKVSQGDENFNIKNEQLAIKELELVNSYSSLDRNKVVCSELINYLEQFIQLRIAMGRKRTSYKEFITVKNRLLRFEEFRLSQGLKRLQFKDLTLRFSDDLIIWMSSKQYDPNTIKKHFVTLKTFVNHFNNRKSEYLEIEFTDDYLKSEFGKVNTHSSPPLPLSDDEFNVLSNCDHLLLNNPSLIKVKDAFLFACVTGLRYSDLFCIKKSNIQEGLIMVSPTKTEGTKRDNFCRIPLNSISQSIIEKYGGSTKDLRLANQTYNKRLKELFLILGFNKIIEVREYKGLGSPEVKYLPKHQVLTSHNARDTFITKCIKSGLSIPLIMEMTGHTKYETMKKYIALDNQALVDGMTSVMVF